MCLLVITCYILSNWLEISMFSLYSVCFIWLLCWLDVVDVDVNNRGGFAYFVYFSVDTKGVLLLVVWCFQYILNVVWSCFFLFFLLLDE